MSLQPVKLDTGGKNVRCESADVTQRPCQQRLNDRFGYPRSAILARLPCPGNRSRRAARPRFERYAAVGQVFTVGVQIINWLEKLANDDSATVAIAL